VVALGVHTLGLHQHLLRAKLDAEIAALAALRNYVYLANGNPDGRGIYRLAKRYAGH
jgi:hypothetical protein